MQKKLLPAIALLMATGIAIPALAQFTLSAGVQSVHMDVESELKRTIPGDALLNDSENNDSTNVGGELAAGYQFNFDYDLNLAAEVFGQVANTKVKTPVFANGTSKMIIDNQVPAQDATAYFNWFVGARLRPGYDITPATRLFLDGGVVWGGFALEFSEETVHYFNVNLGTHSDNTDSQTLMGWRYGAGVEYKMTDNFVVGLDYIITNFEEYNSDIIEDVSAFVSSTMDSGFMAVSKYTPTLHTAGLNFKYLFGAKKPQPQPQPRPNVMRDK